MSKKNNQNQEKRIEEFIKGLSIDELMTLNKMVVERIKVLNQIETSNAMRKYNIGEWVKFENNKRQIIEGRIIKINKKTISIITKENIQWNVHPSFLIE
jgi:predicted transcriptional regulator